MLYMFGGVDESANALDELWSYNYHGQQWRQHTGANLVMGPNANNPVGVYGSAFGDFSAGQTGDFPDARLAATFTAVSGVGSPMGCCGHGECRGGALLREHCAEAEQAARASAGTHRQRDVRARRRLRKRTLSAQRTNVSRTC